MINITEKAAKKIKEMADDLVVGYYIVRVKIQAGGCHGYVHDLDFDDQINENDEVAELDGIKVICDEMTYQYMDGIVLDYLESDFGGGFTFTGGGIKGHCGCGKSSSY
jgi:iron-sulfur cluster assembly accessory protein